MSGRASFAAASSAERVETPRLRGLSGPCAPACLLNVDPTTPRRPAGPQDPAKPRIHRRFNPFVALGAFVFVSVALLAQRAVALDPPPGRSWAQPASQPAAPPAAASGRPVSPAPDERRWIVPPSETHTATLNPQGSFGLELAGGVLASLIGGGLIVLGIVELSDDLDTRNSCSTTCGVLIVTGLGVTIFGPPAAVTIAGDASGGRGSFGWSLVGTLAGTVVGIPGMVAGAIIGYRASAPDENAIPAVSVAPAPDLHGLQLRVGARF